MSTRKQKFDDIENYLLQKIREAGVKDAATGELMGKFYPRAFVWARRASSEAKKLGADTIEYRIVFDVVIESLSSDVKSAYEDAKKIYFDFYDMIWNDPTLGGRCIRALPSGFERAGLRQENLWLEQWVAWIEVLVEL